MTTRTSRYVDLTVNTKGAATIQPHGITGPACKAATASLEIALGPVQNRTETAEYYAEPVVKQAVCAGAAQ